MDLIHVDVDGIGVMEGVPDSPFMKSAAEINDVIGACFSTRSNRVLLYSSNIPTAFFDLSSGEAGTVLQKLRNYRIRLAIVIDSNRPAFSSRFGEMVNEEKKGRDFGIFDARDAAFEWLRAPR
jgi:hypothetical protein